MRAPWRASSHASKYERHCHAAPPLNSPTSAQLVIRLGEHLCRASGWLTLPVAEQVCDAIASFFFLFMPPPQL